MIAAMTATAADGGRILREKCGDCHRAGEAAPFAFDSRQDVVSRRIQIDKVIRSGFMPPWKPRGSARFAHSRELSHAERETLLAWIAAGAPGELPPPQPRREWTAGPPDRIYTMSGAQTVPAASADLYQCFVIPLDGKAGWIRAFEFQPGNRRVVHHALVFIDTSGTALQLDHKDPAPGYRCFGVPGFLPTSAIGGWSPGNRMVELPAETAIRLPSRGALVFQIHYHATGKPESDQSRIGLYFTGQAPTKRLLDVALGSRAIDIPAGARGYRVTDHFTLPVDVDAVGIIPHAHYLARQMAGRAVRPDGRKIELLRIDDWDFNWQENFRYEAPLRLPEGTRLEMDFRYDNSNRNPRNPNRPPQRVRWGPETTDEMAGLHLQVIASDPADVLELTQALWGKFIRSAFWTAPLPK